MSRIWHQFVQTSLPPVCAPVIPYQSIIMMMLMMKFLGVIMFAAAGVAVAAGVENIKIRSTSSSSSSTPAGSARNQDLVVAEEEMQRANYFAYVMLIHMGPPDLFGGGNVTFLMPNDKTLAASNDSISSGVVSDFLQRHSIPSALMFEDMEHIPSGSILPTSKPGLILRVNHKGSGRRSLYLNNVRIISPNICSSQGASIRCHGIDGVIQPEFLPTDQDGGGTTTPPPDQCSNQNDNDNNSTKSRPTPPPAAAASPPPESHNNSESAPPAGTASGAACSGYDRHQLVILLLPLACCCFFFFWV